MSQVGNVVVVHHGDREIHIIGTAHVSQKSVEEVKRVIREVRPDTVCVELDQNRFESMINNLQVTTENLVASESRIRDTDMAAEMVQFTRSQILQQAGTAMLAQANQVPQSVLSLLR